MAAKKIGVLALQGDIREHLRCLTLCGAESRPVKVKEDLQALDGLVLPGGESTAIAVLLENDREFLAALRAFVHSRPTWGTCAGLVMLADRLTQSSAKRGGQTLLGGLKVCVDRNHYGDQTKSFEAALSVTDPALHPQPARLAADEGVGSGPDARATESTPQVLYPFIRAPGIAAVDSEDVQVLARVGESPVAVRQGNLMATSFHPELVAASDGAVWARFFLDRVVGATGK